MRKFAEIYKEKQNRAFESNESKVVLDFKSVYSALLEKYNCVSYKKLNESHQNAFLFELNKYWTEGSGITKDGEKFLKTKSFVLNEQSTVLQKKNFLKNKIKETVHENINGHDLKWKIYDILDEMYHSIKVSSINEILSVDMIDIIIRETFNDVANKFFDEIKHELNESCKTKKKYIIKKKSKKINEEESQYEFNIGDFVEDAGGMNSGVGKVIDITTNGLVTVRFYDGERMWEDDIPHEEVNKVDVSKEFEEEYQEEETQMEEHPGEGDYGEVYYKIDKYMPEDPEVQDEYFEILDDVDLTKQQRIDALEEFFENNIIDEERFFSYAPKDATIREFAKWIVNSMEEYGPYEDIKELPVDESTINERKAKLGSGARFSKLEKDLKKSGAKDPAALAAHIGRRKYGKTKFQKLAAKGK